MVFSKQILVRMHPPLRSAVRAAAERAGLSVSELVRRTLQREIADPLAKGMPSSTHTTPPDIVIAPAVIAAELEVDLRRARRRWPAPVDLGVA